VASVPDKYYIIIDYEMIMRRALLERDTLGDKMFHFIFSVTI
jgi:hypothetical protein